MTAMKTKKVYNFTSDFQELNRKQHLYLEQLMADDPMTLLLKVQRDLANRQLDTLAADLEARELARKQAWGDKYPKILGQLPPKAADATSNAETAKKPTHKKAKKKQKSE